MSPRAKNCNFNISLLEKQLLMKGCWLIIQSKLMVKIILARLYKGIIYELCELRDEY